MRLTFLGSGDAFGSGGRFNTCLKLDVGGDTLLVDIGASAMLALIRAGIATNSISTILFTHFHGDHFAGLPFFLLDACFAARRTAPLTIAGPKGVEARARALTDALYPGVIERHAKFPIRYVEVSPGAGVPLAAVTAEAFPMVHDAAAGPCQGYRLSHAGKTLAFTGDTGWNKALLPLAAEADLLVTECCFVDLVVPNHLCWRQIAAARPHLTCRRMIVTHMSEDMLAFDGVTGAEKAFDGLSVVI
jgi:ribonuclease BN (tRNA processing enzyme)